MANYSLLRYPGGKTKAIKFLRAFLPSRTKEICSPFFGGGSLEIALAQDGIKVHGYDNFKPLVCFWKAVLENREQLFEKVMQLYPLEKHTFYLLQRQIGEMQQDVEIGAAFYVLNRCSFSGTGLSGGMSPGHPRFTMKQLFQLVKFDAKFNIELMCFKESIPKHDCLIYADPPYMIDQKLYGVKGDMHQSFDHASLAELLNARGNFILSYNNSETIKSMYQGHQFFYPEWKYGMGNDKNSKEILIVSKDLMIKKL
jgi:DNA adenine methylase